jgi:hypothetical protein
MMLQPALSSADPILKTTQSTGLMLPPPPLRSQAEAPFLTETGKGNLKAVVKGKGKAQGGYDGEGGDGEPDDEGGDGEPESIDQSYKDKYDISAQFIAQQVSRHSILPETHRADLTFSLGMGAGYTCRLFHFCSQFRQSRVYLHSSSTYSNVLYFGAH